MTERKYYLASGNSEKLVRDFYAERRAAFTAANDLAKEVGGKAGAVSYRMVGVVFEGDPPVGWVKKGSTADGTPYYAPPRRAKADKELNARMAAIRPAAASDLHGMLCSEGGHLGDDAGRLFIAYISAEIIGDKAIITVPDGMNFVPPESRPLKMSEYWALKEQPATAGSSS